VNPGRVQKIVEASGEERRSEYEGLIKSFYNVVTDFYTFGWGKSFHFAARFAGEPRMEAIHRLEYYLAHRLGLQAGMTCIDLGCGIGGPLRSIARFSKAAMTGISISDYQIETATRLNAEEGVEAKMICGDFMKVPVPDGTFDRAYGIEAICHSPDLPKMYKEVYRVTKPSALFASYEWCTTPLYDPQNPEHVRIIKKIEDTNCLHVRSFQDVRNALAEAGWEIVEEFDVNADSTFTVPWYEPLVGGKFSFTNFRLTSIGKRMTRLAVATLEKVGVAKGGYTAVIDMLMGAGESLVEGGRLGIFTSTYFFIARKAQPSQ
jgi:sterol 24-C-methyltransferase